MAAYLRPLAVTPFSCASRRSSSSRWRAPARIDYRLAWVVTSKVGDDMGTWEALVDASNGTVFAFQDTNQYGAPTGVISGGVYPISNDQRPPDGDRAAGLADVVRRLHARRRQAVHRRRRQRRLHPGLDLDGALRPLPEDRGRLRRDQRDRARAESTSARAPRRRRPTARRRPATRPATRSRRGPATTSSTARSRRRRATSGPGTPAGIWLRQQVTAEMNENDVCNAFWDGAQVNFFRSALRPGLRQHR